MPRITTRPAAAQRPRPIPVPKPEHRLFVFQTHRTLAAGQRPVVRVVVTGYDGIFVRLAVHGLPGAIAHARTRRRARQIARACVSKTLHIDPYAFDLQVEGA